MTIEVKKMDVHELIKGAPKQVLPYLDIRTYPKGSGILRPDEQNSSLFLLLEGTAEVYIYTLTVSYTHLDVYKRQGLGFLKRVGLKRDLSVPEKLVVIGGGSTAMDVARTAVRLGSSEVTVVDVYKRQAPTGPRTCWCIIFMSWPL